MWLPFREQRGCVCIVSRGFTPGYDAGPRWGPRSLKATHMIAQGNALGQNGIEERCSLKGSHISVS